MMGLVESLGESMIRLFTTKKGIAGILILLVIAGGAWKFYLSPKTMTPEEEYWWHIEESKRLVNETTQYIDGYYKSTDTETAKKNIETAIELTKKAREHVLLAINLSDKAAKKKYAELLAKSLEYIILSREKLAETVYLVEQGDEEGAKIAGKESHELLEKSELKLIKANAYLPLILERDQK